MSNTLSCPSCGHPSTHVANSRGNSAHGVPSVYRTRACTRCEHRFYTIEIERTEGFGEAWALAGRIGQLGEYERDLVERLIGKLLPRPVGPSPSASSWSAVPVALLRPARDRQGSDRDGPLRQRRWVAAGREG